MNLLITGANGFIGKALARRLLNQGSCPVQVDQLTLVDLQLDPLPSGTVRALKGSFGEPRLLARAFAGPIDVIFHLASVPAGLAEQDYELGRQVNLDDTVALLEAAAGQARRGGGPPIFVFASSIAVIGAPLPDPVTDDTPLLPKLTYGAHKLAGEILLEDFNRRGWLRGRALRLPGIVARPPQRTGQLSAFMSDIINELSQSRTFDCPISADSTLWLMSVQCAIDNLIQAVTLSPDQCEHRRVWTLPAMRCSMTELIEAIGAAYGTDTSHLVTFRSNPALEAHFGRHPRLRTPAAEAVGYRHDGSLLTLVRRALEAA